MGVKLRAFARRIRLQNIADKVTPPGRGYVLDTFTLESLRKDPARWRELQLYLWQFYINLAQQRKLQRDAIEDALRAASIVDCARAGWQRCISLKYVLGGLSCLGSVRGQAGGRFNIGSMNPESFPAFPALYVAEDRDTAQQEMLCQGNDEAGLSNADFALRRPDSIATLNLNFRLDRYIDLQQPRKLDPLVDILSKFTLSNVITHEARRLGLKTPSVIMTSEKLIESLLDTQWRRGPMVWDLPSNSQIFGEMVQNSGIQGIVYPSKMTGKQAVAVFPRTFRDSDSYVEIADVPPSGLSLPRLDSSTFSRCDEDSSST